MGIFRKGVHKVEFLRRSNQLGKNVHIFNNKFITLLAFMEPYTQGFHNKSM